MGFLFNNDGGNNWDWRAQQRHCDELNANVKAERARQKREEQAKARVQLRPLHSRRFPNWAQVVEALETLENGQRTLKALLDTATGRVRWPAFLAAGGATVADLRAWLAGEDLGHTPIRQKQHLRLIATRRGGGLPRYVPKPKKDPPEAA
jgi:hypothetical protein